MVKRTALAAILAMAAYVLPASAAPATAGVYNVRDYGAVGDGTHMDTDAINKAIDECSAAGGGNVVFPNGRYLSGTIYLKSHVTLQVDMGASVLASQKREDFGQVDDAWGTGRKVIAPFIYAQDAEQIGISGKGTIDGQGESWWRPILDAAARRTRGGAGGAGTQPGFDAGAAGTQPGFGRGFGGGGRGRGGAGTQPGFAGATQPGAGTQPGRGGRGGRGGGFGGGGGGGGERPNLVRFVHCKDVVVEGVTLKNSPFWVLHPLLCERVRITGVTITDPVPSPNTDGIDPESCKGVVISDCTIDTGDDCVALKSGTNALGRAMGRPDEDITITNCVFNRGHGVSIGSEMSGGARNITVSNCVFHGTDNGIRIKSQRGRGGIVESVTYSNIVMQDVVHPFLITTFYGDRNPRDLYNAVPVDETTPLFRDILISNVTVRGAKEAGTLTGLRELSIQGVMFSNVHIQAETGFICINAKDVKFQDVVIDTKTGPALMVNNTDGLETTRLETHTPHEGVKMIEPTGPDATTQPEH